MRNLLERALDAEEQLESSRERIATLEGKLRVLLHGDDPDSAERALAWVSRAENAEKLLAEFADYLKENPSLRELLPTGWPQRLDAQIATLAILVRDQAALGERPAEQWWGADAPATPFVPLQRRVVVVQPPQEPKGLPVTLRNGDSVILTTTMHE